MMAQVAPAPAEGTEDAAFVQVVPAEASSLERSRSVRRQSTVSRYKTLSDAERHLAFALRALSQPRTRYALLTTLVALPGPDLPCAGSTEPSMGMKVTFNAASRI